MSKAETMTETNVKLIDAKALVKILSISLRSVWRLRSASRLPKNLTIGGSVRWRLQEDILPWISMGCPNQEQFEAMKNIESKGV